MGWFYLDTSGFGNPLASANGPVYTISFPSDFVSSSVPLIYMSMLYWEFQTSTAIQIQPIQIQLNYQGTSSTTASFNYFSNQPYFIKTLAYYYLLISSKYTNSPSFSILNNVYCGCYTQMSIGTTISCYTSFPSSLNTSYSVVGIPSITSVVANLYSDQLFTLQLQINFAYIYSSFAYFQVTHNSYYNTYLSYIYFDVLLIASGMPSSITFQY